VQIVLALHSVNPVQNDWSTVVQTEVPSALVPHVQAAPALLQVFGLVQIESPA
jgi:hypothetical protein